jgi:hypothetical protein
MDDTLGEHAVVRVPVTPMTAKRSPRSEQVSQAIMGTPVRVLKPGARWCRIETPDEYTGWVPRRALVPNSNEPGAETALVHELWANLRARPDSRLPAALTVYVGTRLPVIGRRSGWVGLRLPDGAEGWVESHRVRCGPPADTQGPAQPPALVETARRFLEIPYLWGGCTPAGLDCSGFVQLVFHLHGLQLRRDTTEQVTQGRPAHFGSLEMADLVFFGERGPESERVTHVGMMLDHVRFIHARGGQCVQIGTLAEEHWQRRLAAARRFLGS